MVAILHCSANGDIVVLAVRSGQRAAETWLSTSRYHASTHIQYVDVSALYKGAVR